jgi:4-diphosphocytidyl-2-C-methyl-D-erythritol kinase
VNPRLSVSPRINISAPPSQVSSLSLKAPAKINWFLQILGRRKDGYHNISSLMQCVSLYDNLLFEHAESIEIVGNLNIRKHDNIVFKAASFLKDHASYDKGARIFLNKNIPVGAGLGGGSSDAAYTLSGLNILWGLGLSNRNLSAIGAQIGSDVPFFLKGPAAFVSGRGERVKSLKIRSSVTLLLVKPQVSVSTAWAYSHFDRPRDEKLTKKPVDIKLFCQALEKRDFTTLGTMLYNDFEGEIMRKYPVVREIKHELLGTGALISAMSGSGPSVFGVFQNKADAERAAQAMEPNFCRVVDTII